MEIKKTELKKIIKPIVEEYLRKHKSILLEMAMERSYFINKAEGVMWKLMEHVLLLAYCSIYDRNNHWFTHWKDEVSAFTVPLVDAIINKTKKSKMYKTKHIALFSLYYETWEINNIDIVQKHWNIKSKKENINFKLTDELYKKYIEIMNTIMEFIAQSKTEELDDYIYSI